MIEVQLSKQNSQKPIVRFDANVIEYFWAMPSSGSIMRMHVSHITSIEVTTNKKGKYSLLIKYAHGAPLLNSEIDDEQLDKVKELVAEVQQAMQSTAL